ncbi:unnamed protein product [Enterobius vermicularis]|uniref:Bestrophin homolog n=1 Tax=Enterobius vermicularis TaxID=51028 RepID=A0A0N4V394_ENTVE|nr:unnamed protein product [Enterobius vermicularis]
MYVLWKCIEAYYFDLANRGYVPLFPQAAVLLYALSAGYVLWNVVIEPRNLRQGYWEFLVNLTAHRVNLLNRRILGESGCRSSSAFPVLQLKPRSDLLHTSAKAA